VSARTNSLCRSLAPTRRKPPHTTGKNRLTGVPLRGQARCISVDERLGGGERTRYVIPRGKREEDEVRLHSRERKRDARLVCGGATDARTTAIGRGIVPRLSAYRPPMRSCGRHCPPPAKAQDFKHMWRKICGMTIVYILPDVSDVII